MSSPFLVLGFLVILVLLFRRPAAEVLSRRLPPEAESLVATLGRPVSPVALAYLLGLGSWLCLVGLLLLMAKEPEQSCEANLPVSCLGLPSWLTHFAWLLVAVPALSLAGAVLAVRSYSRGEDSLRSLVVLLGSLAPGAAFAALYAFAA